MNKFGNIEVFDSSCNIKTVQDGRGAIFTWVTGMAVYEFNMVYFHPNKIRGNHFHPEFTEFFLVVEGTVVVITKDDFGNEINMHAGKGVCFKTPPLVPHAVIAVTQATCISLLTKPWDDCKQPIVYEGLVKDLFSEKEESGSVGSNGVCG